MMVEPHELEKIVLEKLRSVMDPETGADVVRMRLVQDVQIDDSGRIAYVFRPSSPLCPIAVELALSIIQAIGSIPGVTRQSITVVDYIESDALNSILKSLLED